jgi:dienelactone hydrolase
MKQRTMFPNLRLATRLPAALALVFLITTGCIATRAAGAPTSPTTTATTFVSQLVKGEFAAAERSFSPTMQAAAPTAQLKQIWDSLIAQLGAFKRQAGVTEQAVGSVQNVIVHCVFARDTADLVISVGPDGKIVGFHVTNIQPVSSTANMPPGYVGAASFHERAVTVGRAPWALPGTLTLPNGPGPFPAVVLVSGSGPEDRDETIYGNKPFRDLAWGLASRGIAVLRYDKRTLVYGARIAAMANFTVQDEFVDDAVAAVRLLARMPGIDHRHIYVLGHSEGAMMAPLIAQQDRQIAGLMLMAGPTRPLVEVIVDQYTYLQSRGFVTAAQTAAVKQQAAAIKALTPADRGQGGNLLGAPPAYWLSLRSYHPATVAQGLTVPLLIMQGARDYQVTLADFNGWKAALAHHSHVTFRLYANLFHLFMPVPPRSPAGLATPDAYRQTGHIDPQVIHDLVTWLTGARVL